MKRTGQVPTAKCNLCPKVYTGTFRNQSLAAHKRKAHPNSRADEPDGEPPPDPGQPVAAAGAGTGAAGHFANGQPGFGLVSIPEAPKPNTVAQLNVAVGAIDGRLGYLRRQVEAMEAMQAEISTLETQRTAVTDLIATLTPAATVVAEPGESPLMTVRVARRAGGHSAGMGAEG